MKQWSYNNATWLGYLLLILINVPCFAQSNFNKKGWKLVWSDEFNYDGAPDSSKWAYELGYLRDYECQFYTNRLENISVSNGFLKITGRKETYVNPNFSLLKKYGNMPAKFNNINKDSLPAYIKNRYDSLVMFTSASLVTLGKAEWKYGKVEVRAKLPLGSCVWPTIWMMGTNREKVGWPMCGEIDLMEYTGRNPLRVYGNFHYADPLNENHKSYGKNILLNDPLAFHVYTMIWNRSYIALFIDGIIYHEFKIDIAGNFKKNPFRNKFYLLINLALGGTFGGDINENSLPQSFIIDYVRIYK